METKTKFDEMILIQLINLLVMILLIINYKNRAKDEIDKILHTKL